MNDNVMIVNPTTTVKDLLGDNFLGRLVSTAQALYPLQLPTYDNPILIEVKGQRVDLRDMLETIVVKLGDRPPEYLVDVFYGQDTKVLARDVSRYEIRVKLYRDSVNLPPYELLVL